MRFKRLVLLGIAAGWFLLWIPGAPRAGVIEDPHCVPGTVSANGLQPCTACGAGTFSPGYGAIACQTCPASTFASTPGAVSCAEPVTISFDGVVDEIFPDPNGPNPFAIGTTFEGYCIVNPTAPDTNPYAAGNFDGAVIEFAVRAGPIGSPLTGFATSGVAFVSDNSVDRLVLITDDFSGASAGDRVVRDPIGAQRWNPVGLRSPRPGFG